MTRGVPPRANPRQRAYPRGSSSRRPADPALRRSQVRPGWLAWGHGVSWLDLILGAVLYTITGLGVTVGYHRMLTHRSFTALPWLRVTLAAFGAMAFEGDPIGWVAGHRRHHAYTDRPGDPHSPYRYGTGPVAQLRGLVDAHMG